jgi:hypothetical protein
MAKIWLPDYPPASASAYDDEFADASFDTGLWTEWDAPSKLTVSEGAYGLSLLQTTAAGDNLTGVYQAVPPSGNYAIWTKLSLSSLRANYCFGGLLLGQDLVNNPTTSDAIVIHLAAGATSQYVEVNRYNAYNSINGYLVSIADVVIGTGVYFRIRKASTTWSFDYSNDGIAWMQIYTTASIPFTPAQMGLFSNNLNSAVDLRASFAFFRVVTGTPTLADVMPGARVL